MGGLAGVARRLRQDAATLTYSAGLAAAAVATAAATPHARRTLDLALGVQLVAFASLLVAAEYFYIRFRHFGDISSINLMEAVLAPLMVTAPPLATVAAVALAQIVTATLRRNAPVKAAFNVASWSLSGAVGASVFAGLSGMRIGSVDPSSVTVIVALAVSVAAVGIVNHVAFILVLSIANRKSPYAVARGMGRTLPTAWSVGWFANMVLGLLFTLAFLAQPVVLVLLPVPLMVLHVAYRSYAGAHTDRLRLEGLHRAARTVAGAVDPSQVFEQYLIDVTEAFEARETALTIRDNGTCATYRFDRHASTFTQFEQSLDTLSVIEAHLRTPVRITPSHPLDVVVPAAGWRDALVAPLLDGPRLVGALVVVDRAGLEGFETSELVVIEAFARDAAAALARGALVAEILQQREKLARIVDSTSDGIFALDSRLHITTWNPTMARITGIPSAHAVGRPIARTLRLRADAGVIVALDPWRRAEELPSSLWFTSTDGSEHHVSCSYGVVPDPDDPVLVVVVRDITALDEFRELRERYGELAKAEAAQREVVAHLQELFTPPPLEGPGVALGVAFRASELRAPTGGDLYDQQILPDGTLHLAVVDVLGHGVAAANDALTVISTLRFLSFQGVALDRLILETDRLLAAQGRDLVATAIVARYNPLTRTLKVAGAGHPPALVVGQDQDCHHLPAPGGAIGWPGAGSESIGTHELWPGDTFVMYTDGLIEATRDILEGLELLEGNAKRHAGLPADAMAVSLLDSSLAGAERHDDALVLTLQCVADHSEAWELDASVAAPSMVRARAARWLRNRGVKASYADDAVLIASELVTNSVQAQSSRVTCRLAITPGSLVLEVVDDGLGPVPHPDGSDIVTDTLRERGRGLTIVEALTTRCELARHGGITRARAELLLQQSPPRDDTHVVFGKNLGESTHTRHVV